MTKPPQRRTRDNHRPHPTTTPTNHPPTKLHSHLRRHRQPPPARPSPPRHPGAKQSRLDYTVLPHRSNATAGVNMAEHGTDSFIGRLDELTQLHHKARAATHGSPKVVLLSGPTGIGKTTLVKHFTDSLGDTFRILKTEGTRAEIDIPFAGVLRLLDDVNTAYGRNAAHDYSGRQPSVLAVGGAVLSALDTAQHTAPVLLWLDDAHDIDLNSLQTLGFALLRLRADRVLTVVATERAARAARDMGLNGLGGAVQHIVLGGFTVPETRRFLQAQNGRAPSESRLRNLVGWSRGNPLYLQAVLGAHAGAFPDDPGTFHIPTSLSEAVGEWARSFPSASRRILDTLAVLDAPAPVPLLGRLLASDSVVADAEPLVQQHAAQWTQTGGVPHLRLMHTGQREALYAAIPQPEKTRAHRAIAEALEPPARWRHQIAAAHAYDAPLAEDLTHAAQRELDAGHVSLAAEYILASAQCDPDAARRQDALLRAVRLLVVSTQYRAALHHYDQVLRAPSGPQRQEALGLLSFADGQDTRASGYLRRAQDEFTEAGALADAATAAAELGVAENSLGLGRESLASSAFALRHARGEAVRGMVRANLAYGHALLSGPAEGLRHMDGLSEDPDQVAVPDTDTLTYRGMFRGLAGDLAGALSDLSVAARRRSLGVSRISTVSALFNSAWCHFFLGEWQEARRNLSLAFDVAQTTGRSVDFFSLHCLSALLYAVTGREPEAQADLQEALELAASADYAGPGFHLATAQAVVEFSRGELDKTVSLLARAHEEPANLTRSRLYAIRHLPVLAVACARTGDLERARRVLGELESAPSHGALLPVSIQWVKGAIATAVGETVAAAREFEAGLAVPAHGGDPVLHKAIIRHDLGALLMKGGDAERAREQLHRAGRTFERLGARPYASSCRALLGEVESARGRTVSREFWGSLTDREKDIAGLVARGWTNREIAAELYLSTKTIEYHLSNIYAKHNVHDRRHLRDLLQPGRH
ncbi:AAA family ATPase [Streptomyces sp. NPDC048636]|uniref:AAA family ATPase n=1 Tax=Streptomyces sp. NPDC048636 TaxID=3155762 RepID=UPI0034478A7D